MKNTTPMKSIAAAALFCAFATGGARAAGALSFASPFSDHAVIQRDIAAPVWGRAEPGAKVALTLKSESGAEFKGEAVADAQGKWLVKLPPTKAGGPYSVTAESNGGSAALTDILFGDVWICSGQSNMEMTYGWGLTRGKEDIERAENPRIRLLNIPNKTSVTPVEKFDAKWAALTPDAAKRFSAVGFFFGAALDAELKGVPIGLVDITWSGTYIQTWMSLESLENSGVPDVPVYVEKRRESIAKFLGGDNSEYETAMAKWEKDVAAWEQRLEAWEAKGTNSVPPRGGKPQKPRQPSNLDNPPSNSYSACYNGMFAPVFPLAVKGAIWYQGCSNVGGEAAYYKFFEAMAADWRANLTGGDFPIYLVQLAAYLQTHEPPVDSAWARMRWTMTQIGENVKNSGAAVAIDVGHHTDIHPKDKKTVGERLARLALRRTYGRADIVDSGPIPLSAAKDDEGVRVKFKNALGMRTGGNEPVSGFQILGADGKARWAMAEIVDDDIVVALPDGVAAKEVRYAWDDFPVCNLYNAENLPATPFKMAVE